MSLRGSVPEFPLEAVLRFLLTSGKTGVLQVTGARGQGSVGLDAGRLVSASSSEDVDQGDEALGALLALAAAEFDFRPGDLMGPESLSGDTEAILARACSERDRTLRIREIVPHDRLVFRLSDRAAVRTKIELTSDEWRTLLAVNGARDVAGVAAVLHVRSRAALMLLDGLVRAGTVDTEEPPAGQLPPVARSAAPPAPPAPPVVPLPVSAPAPAPTRSPAPVAEPVAPAAKQRRGIFGFGRMSEPAATAVTPTLTIATTRAGKLGSFANALIEEYNSGRYGKRRVEGKITKLLLRVDEQADPIDRPIPTAGDALSVSGLDAGLIPEAQAVPYLAFLVTQIHGDAERAFGRDKAKQGYQVARRQTLPDDPLLGSADLLGRLPRF